MDTLAILVGGGPAPGINGVIASATIEAINNGLRVIGLYDGYRHIALGDTSKIRELTVEDVSRIHFTGGSILRTSRTNPAKDQATLDRCLRSLRQLGVRYLVCIGGDDTTYGATRIAELAHGAIGVATVPKTIDNDLPLPDNAPTFGFETARAVGTNIVESLMEDARTTDRWYLCVSMGRKSGSLALGMCKAAGATLAVIPEEFPDDVFDLKLVVDTIVGSIVKRRASGRDHGVAIIAEGIAERLTRGTARALRQPHARRVRPRAVGRRSARRRAARCGAHAARRDRRRDDRRQQGHRLRIALRETGAVRRRVHAYARVRRGALSAARRQRRADRAHRRPRHAGNSGRLARSRDQPRARANGRRHDRGLRSRAFST